MLFTCDPNVNAPDEGAPKLELEVVVALALGWLLGGCAPKANVFDGAEVLLCCVLTVNAFDGAGMLFWGAPNVNESDGAGMPPCGAPKVNELDEGRVLSC